MRTTGYTVIAMSIMLSMLAGCKDKSDLQKRIERTKDQAELARIAIGCESLDDWAGRVAVRKLTNQKLLARVVEEAIDGSVRAAALRKLTDQALLAKVAMGRHRAFSVFALEKLTDQTELAKVAVGTPDSEVWYGAMRRLTDQTLLANIALEAQEQQVSSAAVKLLSDPNSLMKVARNGNGEVCLAATEKLDDQTLLAKVVLESKGEACLAALNKLTDQALVAAVAAEQEDWHIRVKSVEKLTDEAALARTTVVDPVYEVRCAAVVRMTDQALVPKTAWEDKGDVPLVIRTIPTFYDLPENHRGRLMKAVLPAIEMLGDPDVIRYVGELTSMKVGWQPISRTYKVAPDPERVDPEFGVDMAMLVPWREVSGEVFTFSLVLSKLPGSLEHTWKTTFPEVTTVTSSTTFLPANVDAYVLLETVFQYLPSSATAKFTTEHYPPEVQRAASARLEQLKP